MNNTEVLKRLLKAPLDSDSISTEGINQFLEGIFDAGKMVGFKEGYAKGYEDGARDEHGESRRPFGK